MCLAVFLQAQVEWMTAIQIRITLQKTCHCKITYTHCLTAVCLGLPGLASTRRNIYPLTPILIIRHPLSTSSIYYDPQHPPCPFQN